MLFFNLLLVKDFLSVLLNQTSSIQLQPGQRLGHNCCTRSPRCAQKSTLKRPMILRKHDAMILVSFMFMPIKTKITSYGPMFLKHFCCRQISQQARAKTWSNTLEGSRRKKAEEKRPTWRDERKVWMMDVMLVQCYLIGSPQSAEVILRKNFPWFSDHFGWFREAKLFQIRGQL